MINQSGITVGKTIEFVKYNINSFTYTICILFTLLFTVRESNELFPFMFFIVLYTVLMLTAKFYSMKRLHKYILGLAAFIVYLYIINTYKLAFTYDIVLNKWSFLVVSFILLFEDWITPTIVGMYPALRLLQRIPEAKAGKYVYGQIVGNANGQIAFTVFAVLLYKVFAKLLAQRNRYRELSITDSLTGVFNFSYTIETAKKMVQKGNISILIADMDRFKQVNDTYGHVAGNKVLLQIAELIQKETDGMDRMVGRLGGDEFIIVVRNDGSERVLGLGERLLEVIRDRTFVIDPEIDPINLSFSVGQANSSSKNVDVEKLLHKADINLYYNKYRNHRLNIFIDKEKPMLSKEGYELLNVLAEKDMYTYVHSGYTAQYAAALAKELGFSEDRVDMIYTAGWLHDIGKILISNDIVRKSGSLTDEEYVLIKNHVNYGLSILKSLKLADKTIQCIQYHHECWNGSGYPERLSENSIPPEARILQIADSYSAMIIKRVYRKTLTPEEALEEIERNSGKQFDPEYVIVFNELIRRRLKAA